MKLKGKVAIVTGASRGIGKGIALKLAEHGAHVVVTYREQEQQAREVVTRIESGGGQALSLKLDISKKDEVQAVMKQTLTQFGRIDILVNNAGILQQKPFETITEEDWNWVFEVNMKGTFLCCQEVIPLMREKGGGRIINISSIGGQWGGNLAVHYSAAKAGIISLTKSLARIYSQEGILVNCIAPGLVLTEMIEDELGTVQGQEKLKSIPIGRVAQPEEIGAIVVALASEVGDYLAGQTINANGGMFFGG